MLDDELDPGEDTLLHRTAAHFSSDVTLRGYAFRSLAHPGTTFPYFRFSSLPEPKHHAASTCSRQQSVTVQLSYHRSFLNQF